MIFSTNADNEVVTPSVSSRSRQSSKVTILEIYADINAYKAHIQTPHFLKYKTGTKDMVKSLELMEVDPLVPGMKIKE